MLKTEEQRLIYNAYMRKWNSQHKEKISVQNKRYRNKNPTKNKENNLKWSYGISLEGYQKLYKQQNGLCAICTQPEIACCQSGSLRSLAVDHCHESQKVRGLLCTRCNTALGLLKESKETIINLLKYLEIER